jgi:hypothetical protein
VTTLATAPEYCLTKTILPIIKRNTKLKKPKCYIFCMPSFESSESVTSIFDVEVAEVKAELAEICQANGRNQERKAQVIAALPNDFMVEMKAHLLNRRIVQTEWTKQENEKRKQHNRKLLPEAPPQGWEEWYKKMLKGQVLEMLVNHDEQLVPQETCDITMEVISILNDPDRYTLYTQVGINPDGTPKYEVQKTLGFDLRRNPDAAYARLNADGTVTVEAVGEVKNGRINTRAEQQTRFFEKNISAVCAALNQLSSDELLEHGLINMAAEKEILEQTPGMEEEPLLKVSENFEVILVVPANRRTTYEGLAQSRGPKRQTISRVKFQNMLDKVRIEHAAFTTNEVEKITNAVYEHIPFSTAEIENS